MFENFGLEISKLFKSAELIRYDLRHPYVGSEHLILAILKESSNLQKILKNHGVTYTSFKKELCKVVGSASTSSELNLYTPLLKRIIENALDDAKENNKGIVTNNHLLISMLEEGEGIAIRILMILNVDLEKLYNDIKIKNNVTNNVNLENIVVLNDIVLKEEKVVSRKKELDRIIETLLRHKKNNPILIGKAGVGKTAIVEELARMINEKKVPKSIQDFKIIVLEMGSIVAGTKYRGEFEEKFSKIIQVSKGSNVILFIDEIHTMVSAGSADGAISASEILKPYLARGEIKVIGATTVDEYNKFFLKDKALNRRFEKIIIEEPTIEETKEILKSSKKIYENYHQINISDELIEDLVDLSNKYIHDKCNPDKSLELLDSICAKINRENNIEILETKHKEIENIIKQKEDCIKLNQFKKAIQLKENENKLKKELSLDNEKKFTKERILEAIEERTSIPLTRKKYTNDSKIFDELENKIFGQNKQINEIKEALIKSDSGSILLVGPSGTGKKECVKILSKDYNYIEIDMREYTNENSILKIIGNPYNYGDEKHLFKQLKEKPHSLLFFRNLNECNSKVLNLILNIIENRKINDSFNEEIYFENCLIIASIDIKITNNLGFKNNDEGLSKYVGKKIVDAFDTTIIFNEIEKSDIIKHLKNNCSMNDENIELFFKEYNEQTYNIKKLKKLINSKNKVYN